MWCDSCQKRVTREQARKDVVPAIAISLTALGTALAGAIVAQALCLDGHERAFAIVVTTTTVVVLGTAVSGGIGEAKVLAVLRCPTCDTRLRPGGPRASSGLADDPRRRLTRRQRIWGIVLASVGAVLASWLARFLQVGPYVFWFVLILFALIVLAQVVNAVRASRAVYCPKCKAPINGPGWYCAQCGHQVVSDEEC